MVQLSCATQGAAPMRKDVRRGLGFRICGCAPAWEPQPRAKATRSVCRVERQSGGTVTHRNVCFWAGAETRSAEERAWMVSAVSSLRGRTRGRQAYRVTQRICYALHIWRQKEGKNLRKREKRAGYGHLQAKHKTTLGPWLGGFRCLIPEFPQLPP